MLFAGPFALAERHPVPEHAGLEAPRVVRAGVGEDGVGRVARRGEIGLARRQRLEGFLQTALGIDLDGRLVVDVRQQLARLREHERPHDWQSAVQVHRPHERLEGVRQGGRALPAAVAFVAAAHHEVAAQVEAPRVDGEGLARDQPRAQLGQLAFARVAEPPEEVFAEQELQDGVAEVFEPLVVEVHLLRLVPEARVRERLGQQERVAELVTDLFFERMHGKQMQNAGCRMQKSEISSQQTLLPRSSSGLLPSAFCLLHSLLRRVLPG